MNGPSDMTVEEEKAPSEDIGSERLISSGGSNSQSSAKKLAKNTQ